MTNSELLKSAIHDAGLKNSAIMEALGIKSYSTLREKVNSVTNFTAKEIQILCVVLRLSNEQREQIFFAEETELIQFLHNQCQWTKSGIQQIGKR